jgi:hypothetical protein
MATAGIKRYWSRVAGLGCAVHGRECVHVEIAHVVGKPSVTERIKEPKPKGKKLPRHDWLVLGICPWMHRWSSRSLDLNPAAFEEDWGPVAAMVDRVGAKLGVDPWMLSQVGRK